MRQNDEKSNIRHFRAADRIFTQDGRWWFSTREGEEGPFASRERAETALQRYVAAIDVMEKFQTEQEQKAASEPQPRTDPSIWDRQIDAI